MAVGKEIRGKINSVKNTQKITKAMEMVAASKMRKAQERMDASGPYSAKIRQIINHLAYATPEYRHPWLVERETINRVGFIVVSTDKGLCGGLNNNLFKAMLGELSHWDERGAGIDFGLIGRKATTFVRRMGGQVVSQLQDLGDRPHLSELIGSVKVMLDRFDNGEIDALYIGRNRFVNTMTQRPEVVKLLPIEASGDQELEYHWDYIYEPDAREVLDSLLSRYIEAQVYQAVVENIACEMAARMIAMKNATDNANQLIDELQLLYNKERQAAITQELSEIVSGAAAV